MVLYALGVIAVYDLYSMYFPIEMSMRFLFIKDFSHLPDDLSGEKEMMREMSLLMLGITLLFNVLPWMIQVTISLYAFDSTLLTNHLNPRSPFVLRYSRFIC